MPTPRTHWMTALGILNIVFGTLGCLFAVLVDGVFSAGGGFAMLVGLFSLAFMVMLGVSGFGILKSAPWSRKFATISCLGILATQVISFITVGFNFNLMTVGTLAYCGASLYVYMASPWKNAFESQSTHETPAVSNPVTPAAQQYDQYRDAA